MKILRVGEEEHEVEKAYMDESNNITAYDAAGNVVLKLEGVNLQSIAIFTANGDPTSFDNKKTDMQRMNERLMATQAQVDELILQKLEEQLGGGFDVSLLS